MQSHKDTQHEFLKLLKDRAKRARDASVSTIAYGDGDEQPLGTWTASNGVCVRHMPDDPQGILRISAGGGENIPLPMTYLTIRGKVGECISLLEKAIVALWECPE